jgi:predicted Zn-dependent protease
MSHINWLEILGWQLEELEDIRFAGFAYIRQGQYELATSFFEALVVLSSHNVYDLQTLGALYLQQNNNLQALNYLEKAVKLDPTHDPTLLNRCKALFALGYKKQGLAQAALLQKSADAEVSSEAEALVISHS